METRRYDMLKALESTLYDPIDFKFSGYIQSGKEKKLANGEVPMQNGHGPASKDENSLSNPVGQVALSTKWPKVFKIGPGFYNSGNTCFLNSVLQCITYTPPLVAYFLKKPHKKTCTLTTSSVFCGMCFMEDHINKCFSTNERAIVPTGLIKNLKVISSRFRLGHQQDAHEFMVNLIDRLQQNIFGNPKKLEKQLSDSSVLAQIFSGRYKSTVECLSCGYKSETIERFYDLCLVTLLPALTLISSFLYVGYSR